MAVIGNSKSFSLPAGAFHGGNFSEAFELRGGWCCCNEDPDDCCDGDLLGLDLYAILHEDNDCGCIDGQVAVLTYVPIDANGNTRWQGRIWFCDSGDPDGGPYTMYGADIYIVANRQAGPCTFSNHTLWTEIDAPNPVPCEALSDELADTGGCGLPYSFVTAIQNTSCCNDTNATPDSSYTVEITSVDPR